MSITTYEYLTDVTLKNAELTKYSDGAAKFQTICHATRKAGSDNENKMSFNIDLEVLNKVA